MKKIIVLEGGFNEEHEVSLNTSKQVQKSLKNMSFEFDVILVDPKNFLKKLDLIHNNVIFFNALHGPFGEDGEIQKILEKKNFPFTHSDHLSSKLAFDKNLTKLSIKENNILSLDYITTEIDNIKIELLNNFFKKFGSFVIKPITSGSSYGVKIFNSTQDIDNFFLNFNKEKNIYQNHHKIMIEKYIKARELTVGVFEKNKVSESLAVTEIVSKNSFYDYDAKYVDGHSKHILPADVPSKVYEKCLLYAKSIHDKLGCRGLSRSDFLYDQNDVFFLEINTQPGLTLTSLIPEQLAYRGINFDNFIENILESSV